MLTPASLGRAFRANSNSVMPSGETALTVSVTPLLTLGVCHSLRDYQKHDLKQFHGEATLRFGMLIAIALVALTNAAMAQSKHPQDVQKINVALPTAKITPAQRAQVIKLRNEGEAPTMPGNTAAEGSGTASNLEFARALRPEQHRAAT